FPLLLEMGRPIYGSVCDGYWQDIGNLDQYRQANFDALEERVHLNVPGIRLRGNIWVGEGVDISGLERLEGPAFIGNYCHLPCEGRRHVRVHEGVAIGDDVVLGAESVIAQGVRIYPYKEVESGSQIFESLIWESRASPRLFGKDGVSGLVNVDVTVEAVVRLA